MKKHPDGGEILFQIKQLETIEKSLKIAPELKNRLMAEEPALYFSSGAFSNPLSLNQPFF
jgi:hypothetical protein